MVPLPIAVELLSHDPAWAARAEFEARRLAAALGEVLVGVHHIGSTSIPTIRAKPVVDLLPVVTDLAALDAHRGAIEALGYLWLGEYGLSGRRYCTFNDPTTGRREVQAHCYQRGSAAITRHLAFRDHLRRHPELARAYEFEKCRCRDLHPQDSRAYTDCKGAWIVRVEAEALAAALHDTTT